jgi:hypothetical protein
MWDFRFNLLSLFAAFRNSVAVQMPGQLRIVRRELLVVIALVNDSSPWAFQPRVETMLWQGERDIRASICIVGLATLNN